MSLLRVRKENLMNIFFDNIIFSLQKSGGISVYWYELMSRFNKDKINVSYINYKGIQSNIFARKLKLNEPQTFVKSNTFLFISRYTNLSVKSDKKFIFHSSYYRTCNNKKAINVTTVHDFTYEKYYGGIQKSIHCRQKYNAINNSDIIVCISENTKKDLLTYLPKTNIDKIRVIYNGVSDNYFRLPEKELNTSPDSLSYVLYVGSRESYKRFDLAVKALINTDLKLYIVGGGALSKVENDFLNKELGENRFKHWGSIENKELNKLYNNAFCLLYPSEYEGFGIPVIEAQKAGCPVIAYNGSSVTEIAKDSALLFNNFDEMYSLLYKLNDNDFRKDIIEKGLSNALKFSWDLTYSHYKNLYKEIYDERR